MRSVEKEPINRVLFSLVAAPCFSVAIRVWKNNFTESGTRRSYNSQGFGGQFISSGLTVYWSLIFSLIKEAAFSTIVFLLTEWWIVSWNTWLLITTSGLFTLAVTNINWSGNRSSMPFFNFPDISCSPYLYYKFLAVHSLIQLFLPTICASKYTL